MAIRYSGSVRIKITLQPDDSYNAVFAVQEDAWIELPKQDGLRLSVEDQARLASDSPEAYDEVARAALAFLSNDTDEVLSHANQDDAGRFIVSRRFAKTWPSTSSNHS